MMADNKDKNKNNKDNKDNWHIMCDGRLGTQTACEYPNETAGQHVVEVVAIILCGGEPPEEEETSGWRERTDSLRTNEYKHLITNIKSPNGHSSSSSVWAALKQSPWIPPNISEGPNDYYVL